ncbi:kinase-like domain-containing protein [Phialemonium atrogriseum]|uniref:Kinase-like domain-containing protein n=1 Tax=Phialemonium atrogriseum TaxID=1093897 RepID=A0AAJ0FDF1_9PEZI|nr:kinase-like domain-containing protein [Phialemonium atrogriseum]KAK1763167.1 kinase-like domain-containing protein [Phialemonium atrogriseum]
MGDLRPIISEEYSEQKTEPFSQSEIDARLQSIRGEEINPSVGSSVPLDHLVVPPDKGIRILVRPLTRGRSVSPGNQDNCQWLALRAEIAEQDQPQHKVLAVTQTSRDIKFSVRIPGERLDGDLPRPPLWCELYYDPASDNQILLNRSDVPISLSRVSYQPAASPGMEYTVNPGTTKALVPGTWRIRVNETEVLDFRIIEKRPAMLKLPSGSSSEGPSLSEMVNSSGKRSFTADDDDPTGPERKLRAAAATGKNDDGVIMFLRPQADPLIFPLPTADKGKDIVPSNGHALLDMRRDESADIPGGCELDQYQITKREPIASTALSSVFKADHSSVSDGIITVKVLKTRTPLAAGGGGGVVAKPQDNERNVIRQADIWLREFQSHDDLQHDSIVRLYGGDARYLSLYMEHIEARDLSAKGVWRDDGTDLFRGDQADAVRVLRDIAGALHYIHGRNLVHNDIKPANILYSRERGAVLCDFGLSTPAGSSATTGGTPYYVPPEFVGRKLRGAPSDVWALGVTMLYVLRKIPFPESRGRAQHPRRLYWMIADLNRPPAYHHHHHRRHHHHDAHGAGRAGEPYPSAVSQMQQWLGEVHEARDKLDRRDRLEELVAGMLAAQPNQRITMRQVVKELFSEELFSKQLTER